MDSSIKTKYCRQWVIADKIGEQIIFRVGDKNPIDTFYNYQQTVQFYCSEICSTAAKQEHCAVLQWHREKDKDFIK